MTLQLLEKAISNLQVYLETNMASKIADLNIRYTDDTLEAIVEYYPGSIPINLPANPSICLHGTYMSPLPSGQRKDSIAMENAVDVIVFVGTDDVEKRFRRLCRYTIGLLELLQAGEPSMGYHVSIGGRIILTDTMSTAPFLAGIIIPVTMRQIEDY